MSWGRTVSLAEEPAQQRPQETGESQGLSTCRPFCLGHSPLLFQVTPQFRASLGKLSPHPGPNAGFSIPGPGSEKTTLHSFSLEHLSLQLGTRLSDYLITVNSRKPETGPGFAHFLTASTLPGIELAPNKTLLAE